MRLVKRLRNSGLSIDEINKVLDMCNSMMLQMVRDSIELEAVGEGKGCKLYDIMETLKGYGIGYIDRICIVLGIVSVYKEGLKKQAI